MADRLAQLGRNILAGLEHRPDLSAIIVPGAIGGFSIWLVAPPSAQFLNSEGPLSSLILSLVFGAFAGIILVTVVTNTDRRDTLRLAGMAFLAGLAWPAVVNQALSSLGANLFSELREDVQEVAAFAGQAGKGDDEELDQLIREVRDLFDDLPQNDDLQETAEVLLESSVSDLRQSQQQQVAEIVESLELPNTDVRAAIRNHELWLNDFPRNLWSDESAEDIAAELDEFNEVGTLPVGAVTDPEGRILFRVDDVDDYRICTVNTSEDLVAIIYEASGGERVFADDDSGIGLTPLISERIDAGEYVLKLYHYDTLDPVPDIMVSFGSCTAG